MVDADGDAPTPLRADQLRRLLDRLRTPGRAPPPRCARVQAIVRLRNEDDDTGSRMSLSEACKRVNQLDWSSSEPRWQQGLMNGDRVLAGKSAVNFASRVIAYWLGEDVNDE